MATEIEAARLMVYNAARMKDAGVPFVKEAAMTKLFCSQVAERVTSLAIEVYGGGGFSKNTPFSKNRGPGKNRKIDKGAPTQRRSSLGSLGLGKGTQEAGGADSRTSHF